MQLRTAYARTIEMPVLHGVPAIYHTGIQGHTKIAHQLNGGPTLADNDRFGHSAAAIGDLDFDGVNDLAVGAYYDDTGGENRGAIYVLYVQVDGAIKAHTKIAHNDNGGPSLADEDKYGYSVAGIGDLDRDGVPDLAVGARGDDTGGLNRGALYIHFLNPDGTVKSQVKIAHLLNGGPSLADYAFFGVSVAAIGDLDNDGVTDLAVGSYGDNTGGPLRGAFYILFMNADGTAKSHKKVAHELNGGPSLVDLGRFGYSSAAIGDLNRDGAPDLGVGAYTDSTAGTDRGALYVLFMNTDGSAKGHVKIAHLLNGGPSLADADEFGASVCAIGDLDRDGVIDLAVGARQDSTGGPGRGAFYLLSMNANGTVKTYNKIAHETNGGPSLSNWDWFGVSTAGIGDLDRDGLPDLAAGAVYDDAGGGDRGALYIMFTNRLSFIQFFPVVFK